jgi:hypothetical protein
VLLCVLLVQVSADVGSMFVAGAGVGHPHVTATWEDTQAASVRP